MEGGSFTLGISGGLVEGGVEGGAEEPAIARALMAGGARPP